MTPRILCLWFLNWPIQQTIAEQPDWANRCVLLTESVRGRDLVRFCCERSWNMGVRIEMPLSEARSYCPASQTVVKSLDRKHHRTGLAQRAIWCERYSPMVGLEDAEIPECLWMDVTGLSHLFFGEQSLAETIVQEVVAQGWITRAAIAGSTGMAWAAAKFLTESNPAVVMSQDTADALFSLPVDALRLSLPQAERLRKLGLKTIRQVFELDRSALKVRFKTELLKRLDEFTGNRRELIVPCRPAPMFCVKQQWESGVADFATIEQTTCKLLDQVAALLQERHLGTRCLICCLTTEDRQSQSITIRLRETSAESRHFHELLQLKWESVSLNSPVIKIEVEATETAPLKWSEMRLFADEFRRNAGQLSTLLNRFANRLGDNAVVYAPAGFDPIPEHTIEPQTVTTTARNFSSGSEAWFNPPDRPPCLFPHPRPLDVCTANEESAPTHLIRNGTHRRIVKCEGPERIESGWWQVHSVQRDYFQITLETGERLWAFRRLMDGAWFLHGIWF